MSQRLSALIAVTLQLAAGTPLRDHQVKCGAEVVRIRCDATRRESALVVLEAGAGNGTDSWNQVFPKLAKFGRVCAYDRPRFDEVGGDLQLHAPAEIVEGFGV